MAWMMWQIWQLPNLAPRMAISKFGVELGTRVVRVLPLMPNFGTRVNLLLCTHTTTNPTKNGPSLIRG